jgi:hypothetical protein
MTASNSQLITITQSKLVVVEGEDEKRLFSSIISENKISNIQILPIGGKTNLPIRLKALKASPNFKAKVKVLAVTRDADGDASAAFSSICSALKSSGLPVPNKVLERKGGNPDVIVMIIPHAYKSGKLEDLCLESVSVDPAMRCVELYINCLEQKGCTLPSDISKAKVHAFLASRGRPDLRLGEAAEAGYWPLNSDSFKNIARFLNSL